MIGDDRKVWWLSLSGEEQERWRDVFKAMSEAEREEFFLSRDTREFYHQPGTEQGRDEREAAELSYCREWRTRLGL